MSEKIMIEVNTLPNIICPCGSELFENIFILKKVSALQSPSGKEEIIPLALMVCTNCGKSLEEIMKKIEVV